MATRRKSRAATRIEAALYTLSAAGGGLCVALLAKRALRPDVELGPSLFLAAAAVILGAVSWIFGRSKPPLGHRTGQPERWRAKALSMAGTGLVLLVMILNPSWLTDLPTLPYVALLGAGILCYLLPARGLVGLLLFTLTAWLAATGFGWLSQGTLYFASGLLAAALLRLQEERLGASPQRQAAGARWVQSSPHVHSSEEISSLAARGTNDGFWDWDLRGGQIFFSARWKTMLGCAECEISSEPEDWFNRVHPEDQAQLRANIEAHLSDETPHLEAEYRILHQDGDYRWMLCRGLAFRDDEGLAYRMAGAQTDITERKTSEAKLLYRAFHDELTGLPNRALLTERLGEALERIGTDTDYTFAVLFLDLDRFKNVNDSLGHLVGDELLKAVARRLRSEPESDHMVTRLGGDEFAVLLDLVKSPIEAMRISNTIRKKFRHAFTVGGQEIFITPSIGVAWGRRSYERPEDILRDADIAMYQAKKRGRNCCEVFAKKMHSRAVDLLHLENDLHRAIDNSELTLHYQPIVSLRNGQLTGFEALLRWDHPEQGLLYPKDFLGVAEESGLIVPMGWWVLAEACRKTFLWRNAYPLRHPFTMSVNLSGRQVFQPDLVERVSAILKDSRVDPGLVHLEITESVLMQQADSSILMLAKLQKLGVELHLDDFGTGYSSLSYLDRFTFDALKIDRSFINKLDAKGENWKIVRAMVELAHNLGMDVIVEGLETQQQIEHLRELRCEFGQGYFFSHPIDEIATEALLEKESAAVLGEELYWERAKTG